MLSFRKATKNDIEIIATIYSDIHTLEEKGLLTTGWIRNVYPTSETAEKAIERGDMFVSEFDGEITGAAIINQIQVEDYKKAQWQYEINNEEIMVLHTLVISPKAFKKGFGKEFVKFYEEYALKNGCKYLRMDTNARNLKARTMYEKLGYAEIGIVDSVFNGIEGVKLVLLEKKL